MEHDETQQAEIVINLENNSNLFVNAEIVHRLEFDNVSEKIETYVNNIDKQKNYIDDYQYKTILINGERGSGKTSFLYSLKNYFSNNKRIDGLYVLPYLDPTVIEEKAHILLTIISLIKEAVEKESKNNIYFNDIGTKKDFDTYLQNLSKGLPIIDNLVGDRPDYWDDSFQIMHKGLEDVNSSFYLRRNFNIFVNKSLQILEKKAFLLIIDDVDTDFTKAWPIMEMLRKYVCNEKIITVVSGDFNLFSYATRKQQWKNFGKPLLKNEYDDKSFQHNCEYKNQVLELENQYLKKIFPVSNRINLTTIRFLLEIYKKNIIVKDSKQTVSLVDYYNKIFEDFGIRNPYQRAAYRNYIEGLPLRTQVQFMKIFSDKKDNQKRCIDLIKLFNTELQYFNINSNLLISNPNFLTMEILKFLHENNDKLHNFYQLEPIYNDNIENAVLLCFSLLLSDAAKNNISIIFNYFIRICYIRNILEFFDSDKENKIFNIQKLIQHSNLYSDNDLRQINCHITSFLRSIFYRNIKTRFCNFDGIISLGGLAKDAKRGQGKKDDAFDSVVGKFENPIKRYIASMPLSKDYMPTSNQTIREYSFYTLLSTISDIINECKESGIEKIHTIISKYENIRQYPLVLDLNSVEMIDNKEESLDDDEADSENNNTIKEEKNFEEFNAIYHIWFNSINNIKVPSYVLAKIFTRTFVIVRNITNKSKSIGLGKIMHMFVCALLNSCIIEENEEQHSISVRKDNLATSDRYFFDNLRELIKQSDNSKNFPIFSMFVNCPFLNCFIEKKSLKQEMSTVINENILEYAERNNLSEDLNDIASYNESHKKDRKPVETTKEVKQ